MHLYITGFLVDDSADSSLKFEVDIAPESEEAVMKALGWTSLAEESDGYLPLVLEQVTAISKILDAQLPTDLDLFIGVVD